MKKVSAEKIINTIPDILKNTLGYLKDNLGKNAEKALGDASGTVGIIIKLFGQSAIDSYFENKKDQKLADFGFQTYLMAAFAQGADSLQYIEDSLSHTENETVESILHVTANMVSLQYKTFDPKDVLVIFSPQYHPAVDYVKTSYVKILRNLGVLPAIINVFQKHFNDQIKKQVIEAFGDDYDEHLAQTKAYRRDENETRFLWDMVALGHIGLQDGEDLKYEPTYANWQKVECLHDKEEETDQEKVIEIEQALKPIEVAIEEYFNHKPDNHLDKILFVVADFGKGKSVFLKHYAAQLAKAYVATGEGAFPVYFNLRNYSNYDGTTQLGVISDFLANDYGIKIDDEHFKTKRYVFLIDSLDESGEISKAAIERVISSVKSIQHLDKTICRENRIIMTSRPFDEGLTEQLRSYQPHIINNDNNRPVEYFISIYGFKKDQFNDWLSSTLQQSELLDRDKASGFAKEIIESFDNDEVFNVYEQLVENETLSPSELRRPIFGYMIYQLIINNVDFQNIGKIGVYLSFLNLLTKEAKHINDVNYRVNLEDEFKFRNILHAIAALWMSQRQQGKQGVLNKADICRVLDGERRQNETDNQTMARYENEGVTDIQFLSHSYFGENNNVLHFQHQSFAEILLAEYYLKVFIQCALEKKVELEDARTKLILGEPTAQTIEFLKELLLLLRQTAVGTNSEDIIEKRKLLFPLMAALATEKQNTLFSNNLCYGWYERYCYIEDNQSEYPRQALENWCIDEVKLTKIVALAAAIMESKTNYVLTKAEVKTALFDKEVLAIQNNKLNNLPPDMDRWLALLVGNVLFNDIEQEQFFNGTIQHFEHFFDLIRNWNYAFGEAAPAWGADFFQGINMSNGRKYFELMYINIAGIDFSHSYLKSLSFFRANMRDCQFYNVILEDVDFRFADFISPGDMIIKEAKGRVDFRFISLDYDFILPEAVASIFFDDDGVTSRGLVTERYINCRDFTETFEFFASILEYGLQNQRHTIADIKTWFVYESKEAEEVFLKQIDALQKYEVLPTEQEKE